MTTQMDERANTLPSNLPCRHQRANAVEFRELAKSMRAANGRFLTLWGADDRDRDGRFRVYAAFLDAAGLLVVEHDMHAASEPLLPTVGEFFPSAVRMERAVF